VTEIFAPTDAEQVAKIVSQAASSGTTLDLRGGGSKVAYGRPMKTDAILDVSALSGISLYEPEELVITMGAATPMSEIQAALAEADQHLAFEPPDYDHVLGRTGGGATIGGVIACNLSGPRRITGGAARDHVLGIAAISGRGDAFKSGGRVVKNVTGYDLSKLMAGSMGTLGVMTEVTLKTLPRPKETRTVVILGVDAETGLKALEQTAGSQAEATGLAFLPKLQSARSAVSVVSAADSVTAMRLEGAGTSVADRAAALAAQHIDADVQILEHEDSLSLWAEIRDAKLMPPSGALWRLSLPPASAAQVTARIGATCDVECLFDWAGGLIWVAVEDDDPCDGPVRDALDGFSGHATLVRASEDLRRTIPVFHPQPGPLADLSARIKEAFDPQGVLNPGRMVDGQ
jgi:glycolate oxidase FAD binding subunit